MDTSLSILIPILMKSLIGLLSYKNKESIEPLSQVFGFPELDKSRCKGSKPVWQSHSIYGYQASQAVPDKSLTELY